MPVFVITTQHPGKLEPLLKEKDYPHSPVDSNTWVIASRLSAKELAGKFNTTGGGLEHTVVFEVGSYFGHHNLSLWDWLRTHWS